MPDSEDYELLLPPGQQDMGQEEQLVKPELRKGDVVALYAAMVCPSSSMALQR